MYSHFLIPAFLLLYPFNAYGGIKIFFKLISFQSKTGNPSSIKHTYELSVNEVQVPIINRDVCNEWLEMLNVTDGMICAGYEEGGRDACQVIVLNMFSMSLKLIVNSNAYRVIPVDRFYVRIRMIKIAGSLAALCHGASCVPIPNFPVYTPMSPNTFPGYSNKF